MTTLLHVPAMATVIEPGLYGGPQVKCMRCGVGIVGEAFCLLRQYIHRACAAEFLASPSPSAETTAALAGGGIGFVLGALLGPKLREMAAETLERPPCACAAPKRLEVIGIPFCATCRGLIEATPKEAT